MPSKARVYVCLTCSLVFARKAKCEFVTACVPTGLTSHGSFEDITALSRRLGAGGFLGLGFAWPLHTSGQISLSCTHWRAMQGPFRCQIDECRWGSLQCSTTREVLRDLQIAWSYCRPPSSRRASRLSINRRSLPCSSGRVAAVCQGGSTSWLVARSICRATAIGQRSSLEARAMTICKDQQKQSVHCSLGSRLTRKSAQNWIQKKMYPGGGVVSFSRPSRNVV